MGLRAPGPGTCSARPGPALGPPPQGPGFPAARLWPPFPPARKMTILLHPHQMPFQPQQLDCRTPPPLRGTVKPSACTPPRRPPTPALSHAAGCKAARYAARLPKMGASPQTPTELCYRTAIHTASAQEILHVQPFIGPPIPIHLLATRPSYNIVTECQITDDSLSHSSHIPSNLTHGDPRVVNRVLGVAVPKATSQAVENAVQRKPFPRGPCRSDRRASNPDRNDAVSYPVDISTTSLPYSVRHSARSRKPQRTWPTHIPLADQQTSIAHSPSNPGQGLPRNRPYALTHPQGHLPSHASAAQESHVV